MESAAARFFHAARDGREPVASAAPTWVTELDAASANPEEISAILRHLPAESAERICAAVIRERVEDNEMDRVMAVLPKQDVRALGIAAMSCHYGKDFSSEFERADRDASGCLDFHEFRRYVVSVLPKNHDADASPPSTRQLWFFALNSAIPFVVFGCLDNSIMIVGGDVVDDLVGSTFKLSTLACAAVANTFADVLGISIGNTVEAMTEKLGLPGANLTSGQARLPVVRRIGILSGSVGILIGCIIGMTPLLFIDEDKKVLKDIFNRLDLDSSQRLSVNEVRRVLNGLDLEVTDQQIKKCFLLLDKNGDNMISFTEFAQGYKQLKASLAMSS